MDISDLSVIYLWNVCEIFYGANVRNADDGKLAMAAAEVNYGGS